PIASLGHSAIKRSPLRPTLIREQGTGDREQDEDACHLPSGLPWSAHSSLLTPKFEPHGGRSEKAPACLPSANCQLPTADCLPFPVPYTLNPVLCRTPCAYCARRYIPHCPGW